MKAKNYQSVFVGSLPPLRLRGRDKDVLRAIQQPCNIEATLRSNPSTLQKNSTSAIGTSRNRAKSCSNISCESVEI